MTFRIPPCWIRDSIVASFLSFIIKTLKLEKERVPIVERMKKYFNLISLAPNCRSTHYNYKVYNPFNSPQYKYCPTMIKGKEKKKREKQSGKI